MTHRAIVETSPEWEAMKSARRSVGHAEAVRESEKTTRLQWGLMGKMEAAEIDLYAILSTLIERKIPFVLTGTHGIGAWTGRPRATHDVEILVKGGRNQSRAVKAIRELYPHLETRVIFGVTAFFVPGMTESVIDVTYPHRADIEETLAHPVWTVDTQRGLRYRVPSLEAALANKYGAMLTVSRQIRKRRQDIVDFELMVEHSTDDGQQPIDFEKLRRLGEKARPGGGGAEIVQLVEMVSSGGAIELSQLIKEN